MRTKYLFVTCCLEESRFKVLQEVVKNLSVQAGPDVVNNLVVFDNCSTIEGTVQLVRDALPLTEIYVADRNVGYWSAIHWWLTNVDQLSYTYIIESDMIHYEMERLRACEEFLDAHDDVGSVRLHEYSVKNKHLYDKDDPRPDSRRTIWQRHVNRVTGQVVKHKLVDRKNRIWQTNFLTQLPALNRTNSMRRVFDELATMDAFNELDFQRLYWQLHQSTGVLDGGIWNMEPGAYGSSALTGSWSPATLLKKIGYQNSRFGQIEPQSRYRAVRV